MLNEQTIDKLLEVRLKSMVGALREQQNDPTYSQISFDDRFGMIVDKQWADRKSNHIGRKKANFKLSSASIEDIEYYAKQTVMQSNRRKPCIYRLFIRFTLHNIRG